VRKQLGDGNCPDILTNLPLEEGPKLGSQVSLDAGTSGPQSASTPATEPLPFEGGAGSRGNEGATVPVAPPQGICAPGAAVPVLVSSLLTRYCCKRQRFTPTGFTAMVRFLKLCIVGLSHVSSLASRICVHVLPRVTQNWLSL
jgi:hypothetical protein